MDALAGSRSRNERKPARRGWPPLAMRGRRCWHRVSPLQPCNSVLQSKVTISGAPWSGNSAGARGQKRLLDGYAFRQVARLVHVAAEFHREMIGEQLQRDDGQNRREK